MWEHVKLYSYIYVSSYSALWSSGLILRGNNFTNNSIIAWDIVRSAILIWNFLWLLGSHCWLLPSLKIWSHGEYLYLSKSANYSHQKKEVPFPSQLPYRTEIQVSLLPFCTHTLLVICLPQPLSSYMYRIRKHRQLSRSFNSEKYLYANVSV